MCQHDSSGAIAGWTGHCPQVVAPPPELQGWMGEELGLLTGRLEGTCPCEGPLHLCSHLCLTKTLLKSIVCIVPVPSCRLQISGFNCQVGAVRCISGAPRGPVVFSTACT